MVTHADNEDERHEPVGPPPSETHRRITLLRTVVAAVLVSVAALGVTASVIGVWAGRTTLNTDRWVETVTPLSQDPAAAELWPAINRVAHTQILAVLDNNGKVVQNND